MTAHDRTRLTGRLPPLVLLVAAAAKAGPIATNRNARCPNSSVFTLSNRANTVNAISYFEASAAPQTIIAKYLTANEEFGIFSPDFVDTLTLASP